MTADDEAQFDELSRLLIEAVDRAIEPWVVAAVDSRIGDWASRQTKQQALEAARAARASIIGSLCSLLEADLDAQRGNPLAVLRRTVTYPTNVLREAGVPSVRRDEDAKRLHPDDHYDLTPGAFADFGPDVHEAGLRWGAAKAHLHLQRRRAEGRAS